MEVIAHPFNYQPLDDEPCHFEIQVGETTIWVCKGDNVPLDVLRPLPTEDCRCACRCFTENDPPNPMARCVHNTNIVEPHACKLTAPCGFDH